MFNFKDLVIKNFDLLNLSPNIISAIYDLDYKIPTPIQVKVIPLILQKKSILAISKSGSGKTGSFCLPILENHYKKKETNILRTIILVPTRQLAVQISKNIKLYSKYIDINTLNIIGGLNSKIQLNKFKKGVDIIIATPGRLLDLVDNQNIKISSVKTLVIDEADMMLDSGFINDINKISKLISKKENQILMFSATFSQNIKVLAKQLLNKPVVIDIRDITKFENMIEQKVIYSDNNLKKELLSYYIGANNLHKVLVFVNTKNDVDQVVANLNLDGLRSLAIHGDISHTSRQKALGKFEAGDIRVLVCTSIVSRGIDIHKLPYVINYDFPNDIEDYIHRIGRTSRASNKGEAISIVCNEDKIRLKDFEKNLKLTLKNVIVEGFEPTIKNKEFLKLNKNKNKYFNNKSKQYR